MRIVIRADLNQQAQARDQGVNTLDFIISICQWILGTTLSFIRIPYVYTEVQVQVRLQHKLIQLLLAFLWSVVKTENAVFKLVPHIREGEPNQFRLSNKGEMVRQEGIRLIHVIEIREYEQLLRF